MQPPATPGYWGGDFFNAAESLPPVAESHDRHIPRFDVGLFPATPSQEVAGPYHPPRQSESYIFGGLDSVASLPASLHLREEEEVAGPHRPPRQSESYIFGGLAPVASLPSSLHGHTDWGQSAPEVTSSIRGWPAGASTSQHPSKPPVQSTGGQRSGRVAAQDAPGGASRPRVGATIRTAIVVEDAETDRPRKRARVGAAQRLGNSGWLSDGDIIDYTKAIAAEIAGKPGAERIGFADPSQIQLLLEGDEDAQAAVRHRLVDDGAPPILFVPVHGSGNHWSLLAIDRHANQAYHYDSMVPPDMAHWAPETEQFKQAKTVAGLLPGRHARGRSHPPADRRTFLRRPRPLRHDSARAPDARSRAPLVHRPEPPSYRARPPQRPRRPDLDRAVRCPDPDRPGTASVFRP
jgi:hypothetical protein